MTRLNPNRRPDLPYRMANLFARAHDARLMADQPKPAGEVVAYHGTTNRFVGPPTPQPTWGWGGAFKPFGPRPYGLFISNNPRIAATYATRYGTGASGFNEFGRIYRTRLNPDRIFTVGWTGDYWENPFEARHRLAEAVSEESERLGGQDAFAERYDAMMPPPYDHWGGIESPTWQAIAHNPVFEGPLLPDPSVSDSEIADKGVIGNLATIEDIKRRYARRDTGMAAWTMDIIDRAERGEGLTPEGEIDEEGLFGGYAALDRAADELDLLDTPPRRREIAHQSASFLMGHIGPPDWRPD